MRQVVLDTETTGIDPKQGHRIIEIGCVELIDRKLTGNHYHVYINPDRVVEEEAISVHGITNEFLEDKPRFAQIADDFFAFVDGSELVIHNAAFDAGFINHEFSLLNPKRQVIESNCGVLDTLAMAREKHPGQKNNLDALCKRYGIDNGHRTLHGALLDAEILADLYLLLSGGQSAFELDANSASGGQVGDIRRLDRSSGQSLLVCSAQSDEIEAHNLYMEKLQKSSGKTLW
ncbi:DNA polymerase III subunit epsilon [Oleiphilus sp. HI0009]|nr:DNA polymerase III subunit epsilon [Oleiphilus sp. HI0009]KZX84470.1 DNA polymerase III subunit epsilon [Oleiphilus sp. HI0009]